MPSRARSTAQIASPTGSLSPRHFPVRVFLLSSSVFLRNLLARLLKEHPAISLIDAQEYSALAVAEMIASGCDVLLADPAEASKVGERSLDELRRSSPNFKIVLIEMDSGIADVLSGILREA
jgi:DNA-binding NarL/FixJ family response regulator